MGPFVLESVARRDALNALYREHALWLRSWIRRRLGSSALAADLVQATFCRLLERRDGVIPHSPRSFLATVARRLLVDDRRRHNIERAYLDCHATIHGDADLLTPERIAESMELLQGILELLATLPAGVRQSFVLRRIEGLSHDDIAAKLGISTRTVKRHVAQAYVHFHDFERMRRLDTSLARLDEAQRQVLRRANASAGRSLPRAAMAMLLAVATGGLLYTTGGWIDHPPELRTSHGESRSLKLADASTLIIDSDSVLTARVDSRKRQVSLQQGRILVAVKKDQDRPFAVVTADASATALGTAYVVRVADGGTDVTVVESRVRVCTRLGDACVELRAGDAVRVAGGRIESTRQASPDAATAWTRGWIEADDLPAAEVLHELAQYLDVPLHFDAQAMGRLRVTGSYPLTQPRKAVEALADTAQLRLDTAADGAMYLSPR
jgi:transmembrane sensor